MDTMVKFYTNVLGFEVTDTGGLRGNKLVFLKPHPRYPHIKDLSMMEGREPQPLMECNGFCSSNDLDERNDTENEINYNQLSMF